LYNCDDNDREKNDTGQDAEAGIIEYEQNNQIEESDSLRNGAICEI